MSAAAERERQRQQQLLAALTPGAAEAAEAGAHLAGEAAHGLRAYRASAQAVAQRALASAFPTLAAMLGETGLAAVARGHWRDAPPARGDLGEWGAALPMWIDSQAALADGPWLADCARLDWAVHCCERAADARFDAPSLHALADTDPARLRLVWRPGTVLIESAWPLARWHAAHQRGDAAVFAAACAALDAGPAEAVLVARVGWRAAVHAVDPAELPWLRAVDAGCDLASALERAGPGFDFGAWLARAVSAAWLQGLVVGND